MATITEPLAPAPEEEPWVEAGDPLRRRRVGFGLATMLLGLVALAAFGSGSESGLDFTFVFSRESDAVQIPDLTLAARTTAIVLAVLVLALGALMVVGLVRTHIYLVFGIALALFVVALLVWAARGDDISIIGLLDGTLRRSIPLALGALAGLLCERSGVINIGIEGMLLTGAFTAAITASAADNTWVGLLSGVAVGVLLGAFLGVMSIRYRVDQIIGGTVINFFALGMTSYLTARVLVEYPSLNEPGSFRAFGIPGLDRIPFLGPLLFDNTIYVYLLFVLVLGLWWALFRTRWGLRVRSVGEHPRAADTVGINVLRTRYRAVMLGGAVAGLGGTWFTLDAVSSFDENMTAGRGFIALAAMIFGNWWPLGALGASALFGYFDALSLRVVQTSIPYQFITVLPHIASILLLAGFVRRAQPPAADGIPYSKEEG